MSQAHLIEEVDEQNSNSDEEVIGATKKMSKLKVGGAMF